MARKFNLQPWRDQKRAQQKQSFIYATTAIVVLCLAVFGADYWLQTNHIERQQSAIRLLNDGITKFTKTKKEVERTKKLNDEVTQQINVIQDLQDQRGLTTEILNYLALNTPETVFLSSLKYSNKRITLEGVAANDAGVSQFLKNMENFPYFKLIRGDVTYTTARSNNRYIVDDDTEAKRFVVSFSVNKIKEKKEDK